MDPELKTHLEIIEKELVEIRKSNGGLLSNLTRGIFYGAGYVVGAVLIILIIGWILNIIGVIPALSEIVGEFRSALQSIGGPIK